MDRNANTAFVTPTKEVVVDQRINQSVILNPGMLA
jgi:hypothetical protein